jgi:stage II sporulation protein D
VLVVVCAWGAEGDVRVRIGGRTVELSRERYVAGVLGGESSVFRSDEALKAMAVAARTFAVRERGRHAAEGYDFCATTHCQRVDLDGVTPRLKAIASATKGELLWRDGRPIEALYSLDCGRDPDSLTWSWTADPAKVARALERSGLRGPAGLRSLAVVERTADGRAKTLALAGSTTVRISAASFRLAVGRELGWNTLRSDLYEVNGLTFHGRGAGHGRGLCQRGADRMGAAGRGYRDILAQFYPGAKVGVAAQGITWQKACGAVVCLESVDVRRDGVVLATAERVAGRLPWPVRDVVVRVYPDVATFRDVTGEPGWVAGHTVGRRVHLQPVAKLRESLERTLRHELLHVAVESQARVEIPLWFREGLVLYIERGARPGGGVPPTESELRRTDNPGAARQAYERANAAVSRLVERYGKDAVFGFLRGGLPPEIIRANTIQAPQKSK